MKVLHVDMIQKDYAQSGFSIVELVVVIAILGILMTIGTLNFHQWQVKNNIDRQTRELCTDINTARLNAIHTKKRHSVVFNPTNYVLKNYSSEGESPFAGRILETKQVRYEMMKKPSTGTSLVPLTGEHVVYDTRGFIYDDVGLTAAVTPGDSGAYDCVVLATGRTNMGKMTNGTCSY